MRVSQIVDGQQTQEGQPFSFNLTPPVLFLPIYDHQGMRHNQAGTPGSRNSLEKRPPACEHIIHDHRAITRLNDALNELPQPMIFGLLADDKGSPFLSGRSRIGII